MTGSRDHSAKFFAEEFCGTTDKAQDLSTKDPGEQA
jgi:hypothetical protein